MTNKENLVQKLLSLKIDAIPLRYNGYLYFECKAKSMQPLFLQKKISNW